MHPIAHYARIWRCHFERAVLLAGLALCGLSSIAAAASSGDYSVATNMPGVRAYLQPPQGFDPRSASASELQRYGYPPRPDAASAPAAYARWQLMTNRSSTRINPTLVERPIRHGPFRAAPAQNNAPPASKAGNQTAINSFNWSGVAIYDNANPFASEEVTTQFVVPIAQQAFYQCTLSWDYGSAWIGIDGFNIFSTSPDVFQAGIEFDAECGPGFSSTQADAACAADATPLALLPSCIPAQINQMTTPYYSAWFEWYPNYETAISNFPVNPGNYIWVEIWNTSPTQGNAFMYNASTATSVSIAFSAPSGTSLVGNSVEWIVETPEVNAFLATLTNYVAEGFTACEAYNYPTASATYYPGSSPPTGGTAYDITMVDDSISTISYPLSTGMGDLWFYVEGSAL